MHSTLANDFGVIDRFLFFFLIISDLFLFETTRQRESYRCDRLSKRVIEYSPLPVLCLRTERAKVHSINNVPADGVLRFLSQT